MGQWRRAARWAALGLAAAGLTFVSLRYLLPFFAPFLIAFALAAALRRPARLLARTAGIAHRPAAGLLLCLFAAVVLAGAGYLAARLLVLGRLALGRLPALFAAQGQPLLDAAARRLAGFGKAVDAAALTSAFDAAVQRLAARLAEGMGRTLAALPGMMIPFIFTCVATVYFTLDCETLLAALTRRLGPRNAAALQCLWRQSLTILGRLARVYLVMFCLTFIQLTAGFYILGLAGAPALAALVAVVDILPVLGVGTVLLPWAAVCALSGQGKLAAGLAVLYLVIWVVRQLVEPRLVGKGLGLHPLVTLVCLYTGLRLFGLLGALALPCVATLVWQLYSQRSSGPSG